MNKSLIRSACLLFFFFSVANAGAPKPDLSADLCFTRGHQILVWKAGQKAPTVWSTNPNLTHPALSPSGNSLAVTLLESSKTEKSGSRYLAILDGPGAKPRIIYGTPNHHCYKPLWSPDGTRLIFNNLKQDHWGVSILNRDGSGYRDVIFPSQGPASFEAACWSADGKSIWVFDMKSLRHVDLDGKELERKPFSDLGIEVMAGGATFSASSDGMELLCAVAVEAPDLSRFEFPVEVMYRVQLSPWKATRVSPNGVMATHPHWLPDGNAFLCHLVGKTREGIYRVDLGSKKTTLLVGNASEPSLSALDQRH